MIHFDPDKYTSVVQMFCVSRPAGILLDLVPVVRAIALDGELRFIVETTSLPL